jgi:uncharacterized HAD superfamily protein
MTIADRSRVTPLKIRPSEVAFDIDGVLADTMSLFINIAEKDFGVRTLRYEDLTEYDIDQLGGLDRDLSVEIIRRILDGLHESPLEPLKGAPDVLRRLNRYHRPTLFVTARPHAGRIYSWILDVLDLGAGDIDVVATGSFEDKKDVLLDKKVAYFVEDRLETCFLIHDAGISPIVFKQPWNRKPHPFPEVGNWQELETMIAFE